VRVSIRDEYRSSVGDFVHQSEAGAGGTDPEVVELGRADIGCARHRAGGCGSTQARGSEPCAPRAGRLMDALTLAVVRGVEC